MFAVRRRGKRGRHEDGYKVLSRAIVLEILESNYMHILWSNSSNIPINQCRFCFCFWVRISFVPNKGS
jgi:hypothetical protein